jgi:hypothetical protein
MADIISRPGMIEFAQANAHTQPIFAILNFSQLGGLTRGLLSLTCGRRSALGDVCHGSALQTSHRAVT